ncbi:antitoxin MazE7 [Streptomyces sp. NPDC001890]|uniref:antitoxin MazE7 n=1 Tax=Streptomyces sp. NPDC001890 TaxID=3364620 RepID=UPI00368B559A
MEDTSVKIDRETADRLRALAGGQPLKHYLADLAKRVEHERALDTATASFRRVIGEPSVLERFDADFGGLPGPAAHETPRAA